MLDRYADAARHALGEVAATQGEALEEAARLVADSVASQNLDGRPALQDNAELVRPYLARVRARPTGPAGVSSGAPVQEGDLP